MRLISSGIVRSKLRRPASTCAIGISSFAATSDAAIVELTSPTTTTRSGRSARQISSNAIITFAVCTAWLAEPTPRSRSGVGSSQLREEAAGHRRRRSAGRC